MTDILDPLITARNIETTYKRYLTTILHPKEASLRDEFVGEVGRSRDLTKGPLLETTPPYAAGQSLNDLIDEGVLEPSFARLSSPALPLERPLYAHQENAIRKVVAGLTREQLDAVVVDPLELTGSARDQVDTIAARVGELAVRFPEGAAYRPGAVL